LGQHHSDANGLPWEPSSKLAPRLAVFQNNPSGEILNPPRDWRNRLSGGKSWNSNLFFKSGRGLGIRDVQDHHTTSAFTKWPFYAMLGFGSLIGHSREVVFTAALQSIAFWPVYAFTQATVHRLL